MKIIASEKYLPENIIDNKYYNDKFNLDETWIEKRTGICKRYFAKDESIESMAIKVSKKIIENNNIDKDLIDLIIVTTTSSSNLMPGISYLIRRALNIEKCICLDILSGCGGFPNGIDIAYRYIETSKVRSALIVGVEKLSDYIDKDDLNSSILFGDGAGALVLEKSLDKKFYESKILSTGQNFEILTCDANNKKIKMDGTKVYKFAVSETVKVVKELLEESKCSLDDIKYIIPHQSNQKILDSITSKLNISKEKMYSNVREVGNTFCASIPIAFDELYKSKKIKENDKVLFLGYGRRT